MTTKHDHEQDGTVIERDPVELTLLPNDIERLENGEEVVWTGSVAGMTVVMQRRDYDDE